jgi:hypothetical protein
MHTLPVRAWLGFTAVATVSFMIVLASSHLFSIAASYSPRHHRCFGTAMILGSWAITQGSPSSSCTHRTCRGATRPAALACARRAGNASTNNKRRSWYAPPLVIQTAARSSSYSLMPAATLMSATTTLMPAATTAAGSCVRNRCARSCCARSRGVRR